MRRGERWIWPLLAAGAAIVAWVLVKAFWQFPAYILPGPLEVLAAGWDERERLLRATGTTLTGAAAGFGLAAILGALLALALGGSWRIRAGLYPLVLVLQMVPVIVLAPLFMIWVGAGLPSVILITFLIGFFPVVAATTQGLISTDRGQRDLFRLHRAAPWQELLWLKLPSALPWYFAGLRVAASLAMIGAIAGEFFAGSSGGGTGGLGFLVIYYNAQLMIPALFAAGLIACLTGFVFVSLVLTAQWLCLRRWHESALPADD
ncbi:MAG: ABC transporter permease subunit [Puniceicoccaceae bacterium]|nr:MAG: ABC transporter permease subunit [Puniceicoccaceae bacterium]